MSEKEKQILEGVSKLPDPLKDRFLDQIQGASMALDLMGGKEGGQHEPGKSGIPRHDCGA